MWMCFKAPCRVRTSHTNFDDSERFAVLMAVTRACHYSGGLEVEGEGSPVDVVTLETHVDVEFNFDDISLEDNRPDHSSDM